MSKDNKNKADVIKEINFNNVTMQDAQGRDITIVKEMVEPAFESIKRSIVKSYQQ